MKKPVTIVETHAVKCRDNECHGLCLPKGQGGYDGPVCPECDHVANAFMGGHEIGCTYWAPTPGRGNE